MRLEAIDTANSFQSFDTASAKARKVLKAAELEAPWLVAVTPRGRFVPVVLLPPDKRERAADLPGLFVA